MRIAFVLMGVLIAICALVLVSFQMKTANAPKNSTASVAVAVESDNEIQSKFRLYAGRGFGDPDNGRIVFESQCSGCHGEGGVGPNLPNGHEKTRQELIEKILHPRAMLRAGCGKVTVEMADGSTISGKYLEESADTLKLRTPDALVREVQKAEVLHRQNETSMPDNVYSLFTTEAEFADVIAFLSGLRGDAR
jgi:putative heme-binding domain-containing protein